MHQRIELVNGTRLDGKINLKIAPTSSNSISIASARRLKEKQINIYEQEKIVENEYFSAFYIP